MAHLCMEHGEVDRDLVPLIVGSAGRHRPSARRARPTRRRARRPRGDDRGRRSRPRPKERRMSDAPIRVLFVCTGNSARSQIAEAILATARRPDFEVFSAGTSQGREPVHAPGPRRRRDRLVGARSKSVDEFTGQSFDYVITVCDRARQSCPVFPGPTTRSTGASRIRLRWRAPTRRRLGRLPADLSRAPSAHPAVRRGSPPGSRSRPAPIHRRVRSLPLGPALVAEAIGTFALVFTGCGAIVIGTIGDGRRRRRVRPRDHDHGLRPWPRIGAHFNPAVTVGVRHRPAFPPARVVPYWSPRSAARSRRSWSFGSTLGGVRLAVTQPTGSAGQAVVWEAILTFFLMLVIVAVATDSRAVGQAAAIAIGGAVALGSLVGGPVSGASMNPARSIGPALVSGDLDRPVDLPPRSDGRRHRRRDRLPLPTCGPRRDLTSAARRRGVRLDHDGSSWSSRLSDRVGSAVAIPSAHAGSAPASLSVSPSPGTAATIGR